MNVAEDKLKDPSVRMWNRIVSSIVRSLGPSLLSRSDEDRQFFQARLTLLSRVGCIIAFAATTYYAASSFLLERSTASDQSSKTILLWLGSAILLLAVWQASKRRRLGVGALRCLDSGVGILLCTVFSVSYWLMDPIETVPDKPLLAAANVLILRAILLPSTALWTLVFGLFCTVPVVVFGGLTLHRWLPDSASFHPARETAMTAQWMLIAVGASTVTSAVIYRLRRSVHEACKLGQYTLEKKLGEGGMGIVYRARHALLRRPTAVKLLRPESASDDAVTRFEREVQQTSRLTHPNTIAIYDYGRTPDGIFYYAMEYLEGLDLQRLVRETGPMPPARAIHILKQVASSLVEAHEVGLIHRDIKPSNIILCERGGVFDVAKVLDFGLVKSLTDHEASASSAHTVIGTPDYMAPETFRESRRVDGRGDLYALGAMAYFLVTGRPPFIGGSAVEVLSQHLQMKPEPPSSHMEQRLSPDFEGLILRCLEKDPDARPGSARELVALLESLDTAGDRWTQEKAMVWWRERRGRASSLEADGRPGTTMSEVWPPQHGPDALRKLTVVVAGR